MFSALSKNECNIGLVLSTVTETSVAEMQAVGILAEDLGFKSIYVNEGKSDALACVQSIASATKKITVGTNIANIHYRQPYLTAATSKVVSEISQGRFVLGLGISHAGLLKTLGLSMGDGRIKLGAHAKLVADVLNGESINGLLKPKPSEYKIPIYLAGNTVESARLAGKHGDGIMPYLTPRDHLPVLLDAGKMAAIDERKNPEKFQCVLSIPTFLSTDDDEARSAAKYNLAFFSQLPNYRRQWRRAGFGTAMTQLKNLWHKRGTRHEAMKIVPDELLDQVCLVGSVSNCLKQIKAFIDKGAGEVVLAISPVNGKRDTATAQVLRAFHKYLKDC
jgi:alkanesulfonate monooxygenase SsuD/methylene tetrahydromethanopterin reductase-like flavin-dependent oxidoreductase (luciferase family)